MQEYRIKHITQYRYPSAVIDSANQVMLFPLDDERQQVRKHELLITHQPIVETFTDYFGNTVGIFSVIKPHYILQIQSIIQVITQEGIPPPDNIPATEQWKNLELAGSQLPYLDFLLQEHCEVEEEIRSITREFMTPGLTPFDLARKFSAFIYDQFEYKKGITDVETKVDDIWKMRAGVCQDFAHVILVMLRMAAIPARYVSGYICPKNHELRGEGATHAWVEAYIPFHGWTGIDPTNNCIAGDRHVRLAVGRNFSDCTPVKGTYKGCSEHTLEVSVIIENGEPRKEDEPAAPVFTYQVNNPSTLDNSYRRFMEMQQQQ